MTCRAGPDIINANLVFAVDFASQRSFSTNAFRRPTDITTWYTSDTLRGNGTGSNCNVSQDATTSLSPAGGIPMKMVVSGNVDPHISSLDSGLNYVISTAATGQTWNVSVYVKADQATNGELYIAGANATGRAYDGVSRYFALSNKTFNITTEWVRQTHDITINDANVAFLQIRLDGPNAGGNGRTVWWDGLQIERSNSGMSAFNPFHNANLKNVLDLTASGINGNTAGNTRFDSSNGGCLLLRGTADEYINFGVNPNNIVSTFTAEAWFRPVGAPLNGFHVLFQKEGGYSGGMIYGLRASDNSTAYTHVYYDGGAGNAAGDITGTTVITKNNWWHLAATYDSTYNLRLYVNGVQEANTVGTRVPFQGASDINIGAGDGRRANGHIALARVYNRALTAEEIRLNYLASKSKFGF